MQTDVAVETDHSLSGIKLFAGMPADALNAVEEQCRWVKVGPEQTVVARDDRSEQIIFVVNGTIRVTSYSGDGSETALGDVSAGDLFGDLSAINSDERSAEIVGDKDGLVAIMSGEAFRSVLMDHPPIAIRHVEQLANELKAQNCDGGHGSGLSPRQRVFVELIQLAVPNPVGDGSWLIDKVPNHDEIASRSSTEKTEVAMAIGTLARDGIIERKHRTLVIRDHPRLNMLANMQ